MRPADRVAVLTAMRDALDAEIEKAKIETLAVAKQVGVKSFSTDFGPVTIGSRAGSPGLLPGPFLAWVKVNAPLEVEQFERVRPAYEKAFRDRVSRAGDAYVWPDTGEVLDFVIPPIPGTPYVTWPSSEPQKEAKAAAKEWAAARAEALAAGLVKEIEDGAA